MSMLRSIREKKGLTLGQLAARASIPSRTLTEYEEGRQPIPLSHAKLLAKALWVQIEDLMPPAGSVAAAYAPPAAPPRPPVQSPPSQPSPQYPQQPAPATGEVQTQAPLLPPRPADQQGQRPYRDPAGTQAPPRPSGGPPPRRTGADGRPVRPPRPASAPPKPITDGQTEELLRLGTRLGMEQAQMEEQIGRPIASLTRSDAKDWIKKLRETAAENGPSGKVRYGHWPGSREDEEAAYLSKQREAGNVLRFKLFNGEEFTGTVTEFTPYTITVKSQPGGEEAVLRKLAIVYYRQTGESPIPPEPEQKVQNPVTLPPPQVPHSHPGDDTGVDSDRVGEPGTPEPDKMDEDRGL